MGEQKVSQKIYVLLTCTASSEFHGCQYALVELDLDKVVCLLSRIALADALHRTADPSLCALSFWDSAVLFMDGLGGLEELLGDSTEDRFELSKEQALRLPEPAHTKCDNLVVSPDGAYWECYPEHRGVRVETEFLGKELLEEYRDQLELMEEHLGK